MTYVNEKKIVYRILLGKPEGRNQWEKSGVYGKFGTDLRQTGRECLDLINVAQDMDMWWTVVKTAVNL